MDFGYYPRVLDLDAGPVHLRTLPDLGSKVEAVAASPERKDDWVFAPAQRTILLSGGMVTQPHSQRTFALPKTHSIECDGPDADRRSEFHIWILSFLLGMRLTTTPAGFLDATPIVEEKLVDFVLTRKSLANGILLAERFYERNAGTNQRIERLDASIHALFLAQNPLFIEFEEFIYLYTALDACYALWESFTSLGQISHGHRFEWMCLTLGLAVPSWAAATGGGSLVAAIRNGAIHEGLYLGAPLGFALHTAGNQNLNLEMRTFACRVIVALLGGRDRTYLKTATNLRQKIGLEL